MQRILIIILAVIPCVVMAQKKEIGQARAYIKSGKDYDKAETLMTNLLKNAENRKNPRIYETWYDAVRGQYDAANEKLYLKQKYDTAAFFNLTYRMYAITEALDSLDVQPDEKGRVKLEYRKDNAAAMNQLRRNLYFGGTHHLRKNDYGKAFQFFDMYLDADRQPLFTGYNYNKTDTLMPLAAYWATFCGYKMSDPHRTLKYGETALRDRSKASYTLLYMAEAHKQKKEEEAYLEILRKGSKQFPTNPYFFPNLADYYTKHQMNDSALVLANQALEANPNHPIFLLAKSNVLLNMKKFDDCIKVTKVLIIKDKNQSAAYFNMASAYYNQGLELKQKNDFRTYGERIKHFYESALPFMEKYRSMAPLDKAKWAPALYNIYLELNMGKQFEEIDRLMKK
jgi:uncharacterized protein YxeA